MNVTGSYRIALQAGVDEAAFVKHMIGTVFASTEILQLTRTTRSFDHVLLRATGLLPVYVWQVTVDVMTDVPYDFQQNAERVSEAIKAFGALAAVEAYTVVAQG